MAATSRFNTGCFIFTNLPVIPFSKLVTPPTFQLSQDVTPSILCPFCFCLFPCCILHWQNPMQQKHVFLWHASCLIDILGHWPKRVPSKYLRKENRKREERKEGRKEEGREREWEGFKKGRKEEEREGEGRKEGKKGKQTGPYRFSFLPATHKGPNVNHQSKTLSPIFMKQF